MKFSQRTFISAFVVSDSSVPIHIGRAEGFYRKPAFSCKVLYLKKEPWELLLS